MYEFLIIIGIITAISVFIVVFSFVAKHIINLVLSKRKSAKPKIIIYHRKWHE